MMASEPLLITKGSGFEPMITCLLRQETALASHLRLVQDKYMHFKQPFQLEKYI